MKLKDLNDWLTLFANLGVLIGLIFLITELNLSNRISTATMEGELRNRSIEINSLVSESTELADALVKLKSGEGLLPSESEQLYNHAMSRVNIWSSAQAAYDNGMISEPNYQRYLRAPAVVISRYPGIYSFFSEIINGYQIEPEDGRMWAEIIEQIRIHSN